jgi:hypothetical protein
MFAYCANNPINNIDRTGCFMMPLATAWEFLDTWFNGDGTIRFFNDKSNIAKRLKKSKKMKKIINDAIEKYKKTGQKYFDGVGEFTKSEDGADLYLSTQHFTYHITVLQKINIVDVKFGPVFQIYDRSIKYTAIVTVQDKYNFDEIRPWQGLGNILNNMAYMLHEGGFGRDYEWFTVYTYETNWIPYPNWSI